MSDRNQSEAAVASVCNAVALDILRCGAREIESAPMADAGRHALHLLKDSQRAPEYPCVQPSRSRSAVHLGTVAREKYGCLCRS